MILNYKTYFQTVINSEYDKYYNQQSTYLKFNIQSYLLFEGKY